MQIKQVYVSYDRQRSTPAGGFRYCPFCRTELALADRGHRQRPTCPQCGFVHFRNPAPAVSILIVDGERVLLGRRRADPGAGQWAIPSGYVEYEDDFLTTAIREAKEETGLDVSVETIVNVVSSFLSPRFHFLAVYVVARAVGGALAAGDDLAAVEWFPLSGPLPEMAFQEDVDALRWFTQHRSEGLPVDPEWAG
jgi:ADP-ribose pyrophosphatase YjhB (NUDIX family)